MLTIHNCCCLSLNGTKHTHTHTHTPVMTAPHQINTPSLYACVSDKENRDDKHKAATHTKQFDSWADNSRPHTHIYTHTDTQTHQEVLINQSSVTKIHTHTHTHTVSRRFNIFHSIISIKYSCFFVRWTNVCLHNLHYFLLFNTQTLLG